MATLQSPGVSVSVIDQSNYASTGPGTVPFILLATSQDKTSTSGGLAAYTTKANAGVVQLVNSQKELLTNYGLPSFPLDGSGNRIFGSELAEYGLMAAHSVLGLTNSAFILRADVNLAQLQGTTSRPVGNPVGGTLFQNTSTTEYGIFEWNDQTQEFDHVMPTVITTSNKDVLVSGTTLPQRSYGNIGDYVVVAYGNNQNPTYVKAYDNTWQQVGTASWISKVPTVRGNNIITSTSLVTGNTFKINTTAVTVPSATGGNTNATLAEFVAAINTAGISGVTAAAVNNRLYLFASTSANSTGAVVSPALPDGKIEVEVGVTSPGTLLTTLGIQAGTYNAPSFVAQPHYNIPAWRTTDQGTNAAGLAVLGNGAAVNTIASVIINNPGSGYTTAPDVTIGTALGNPTWIGSQTLNLNEDVSWQGYHYKVIIAGTTGVSSFSVPTAPVTTVVNGTVTLQLMGSAASAVATITSGSISAITVTNPGTGYTSNPPVNIAAPAASTTRPSGSIWLKTTPVNQGAKFSVYNYNSNTTNFDTQPAAIVNYGDEEALRTLDPNQGGLGIPRGALYIATNFGTDVNQLNYRIMQRIVQGPTVITGLTSNPTLVLPASPVLGDSFNISVTTVGSNQYTTPVNIETTAIVGSQSHVQMLAQVINSKNIPNLLASVTADNKLVLTHKLGGSIKLKAVKGIILDSLGIAYSAAPGAINTPFIRASDFVAGELIGSNFAAASRLFAQETHPVTAPADGAMWYFETPLEVDVMINDGSRWRGYRSARITTDSRGYNLQATDTNGVIISASMPTTQSDGKTPPAYGDLWLDTSDLENYPQFYRWQNQLGNDQWVSIDVSDTTSSNGMLFADARWDSNGTIDPVLAARPTTQSLLSSDYTDLDCPDPTLYPRGILLFNTRRSSYNVKQYVANKFTNENYPLMPLPAVAATWHSASGKKINNVPYFGRRAQRNVVVSALREAVDMNADIREDQRFFNLLVCPGYPEVTSNLVSLNNDRRATGFVLTDTPMGLPSDGTSVQNYISNIVGANDTSEDGLVTVDSYTAAFYPGAALTNALDGVGQVVVPITHAILRMVVKSDQNSYPWFAPAGSTRGTIDNVSAIGYVDRASGKFYKVGTNQGLRDILYSHNVNPVSVFPGVGIVNYGNHTRQANATALDRINVARLVNFIRYQLEVITKPLVFEPNDKTTRNEAKQAVESLMNSLVAKRGLYDYLVVCDETNNTPSTIDRNELHIDIAIEPAKAVEFVYIPVRILNTGAIKGTGVNNNGLSNTTSSVALG